MEVMYLERVLIEHLGEAMINLALDGILCFFGIQYILGKQSIFW